MSAAGPTILSASAAGRSGPSARPPWRQTTAAGLVLGLLFCGPGLATERADPARQPAVLVEAAASPAVRQVATWILETADNQGLPFLIVDKTNARVLAFDGAGRLLGASPVLLGLGRGDVSPPGIGDRPLSAIAPGERITPAGRFQAAMGRNLSGKGILWIDYDAALSLHPVITTRPADRRLQRLETATADDNRISYGCLNVPGSFFEETVEPAFNGTVGVVYILPEVRRVADVFVGIALAPSSPPTTADLRRSPQPRRPPDDRRKVGACRPHAGSIPAAIPANVVCKRASSSARPETDAA